MRALDRLISFIYSIIMLAVSIVLILVGVGVVDSQMVISMIDKYVFAVNRDNLFNPLTIAGIVLLLASLKTTIFLSLFKIKDKSPILVKSKNGEVEIAQETITNTVRNVAMSFDNVKDVQAKMIKKRRGVIIYAMLLVYVNTNIRETTDKIQNKVKEVVKNTTGVNVIEVNIKVKNVYQKSKKNDEDEAQERVAESNLKLDETKETQKAYEKVEENIEKVNLAEKTEVSNAKLESTAEAVAENKAEDVKNDAEEVDPNQITIEEATK